jgi:hypothetical protein
MPIIRANGQNILFMHIPKSGGTSVESWLEQSYPISLKRSLKGHELPVVPQHIHAEMTRFLFDESFFDYSFAVVRNPYARMLSEYKYRMSHRRRRERILPQPSFSGWVRSTLRRYERDNFVYSNHIRPQHQFLFEGTEVFRLEDGLDGLQARLTEILGVAPPNSIPFLNKSRTVEIAIDDATAALLAKFYGGDFEALGYSVDSYKHA